MLDGPRENLLCSTRDRLPHSTIRSWQRQQQGKGQYGGISSRPYGSGHVRCVVSVHAGSNTGVDSTRQDCWNFAIQEACNKRSGIHAHLSKTAPKYHQQYTSRCACCRRNDALLSLRWLYVPPPCTCNNFHFILSLRKVIPVASFDSQNIYV